MASFLDFFTNSSWLELIAVFTSIAYLVLVTRKNSWCWFFSAISVGCYLFILFEAQLWMEFSLQFFYLYMTAYGFWKWQQPVKSNKAIAQDIRRLSLIQHGFMAGGITLGTFCFGHILSTYTTASLPYIDSFTTIGALFCTWMVTQKFFENWHYWFLVDGVAIYMYWYKGLNATAGLFVVYELLVIVGIFQWRSELKAQQAV